MENIISRTSINNKLYDLECACRNAMDAQENPTIIWIYDSMAWHICSGRASVEFLRAFISCDKRRFPALIKRCMKSEDTSTLGNVKAIKKFLKVA